MRERFKFGVGGAVGDNGLNEAQKVELMPYLVRQNEAEKTHFLNALSVEIDKFNKSNLWDGKAIEAMNRIKAFSQATHDMKRAIENLSHDNQDAFRIYAMFFDELTHATKPAIQLSNEMREVKPPLENVLSALHKLTATLPDLEQVADYTLAQIEPNLNNGLRKSDGVSKQLAIVVTRLYLDTFKELPPYSRSSWFYEFMVYLGNILKIKIGARTLEYAHKTMS